MPIFISLTQTKIIYFVKALLNLTLQQTVVKMIMCNSTRAQNASKAL